MSAIELVRSQRDATCTVEVDSDGATVVMSMTIERELASTKWDMTADQADSLAEALKTGAKKARAAQGSAAS